MEMLAARLAEQDAAFSVLFSDIGKAFYGRLGWTPYESTHLAFPVPAAAASPSPAARPILDADVEALARRDEELLRTRLCAPAHDPAKTRVAVVPDLDTLQWHFAREALMSTHLFSETPTVRGAVYTPADAPRGARVWAYWVRNQAGGTHDTSKNVVEFLRLVVEDEAVSDAVLGDAIAAIASLAQAEARQWRCTTMKLWNPGERVERLVASMSHLNAQLVVRESDSITSLRWLGSEHVAGIDWVANEKFEWC
ncbi:hypothetical protein HIM_01320 [Hirsutella minnesotensis 3608]|nr:hypothetical protein HIM_01320 [Hirsutella minnesotensis 3608]